MLAIYVGNSNELDEAMARFALIMIFKTIRIINYWINCMLSY